MSDSPNSPDSTCTSGKVCDHGPVNDPKPREAQLPSKRVELALRDRIAHAEWKSGERLPPVAELATFYGVARSTVVTALRRLKSDGLVEIVSNWGTFRK